KSVVRMCQAGWMDPYLSDKFEAVQQEHKRIGLARFIADERIAILVADKRLRSDPRFADDPEWAAFQKAPESLGFAAHKLPYGTVVNIKDDPPILGDCSWLMSLWLRAAWCWPFQVPRSKMSPTASSANTRRGCSPAAMPPSRLSMSR